MSGKRRAFGVFDSASEDSDDSDYNPGDKSDSDEESRLARKKKRAKVKVSAEKSGIKKTTRKDTRKKSSVELLSNGVHILHQFPPEILVLVFQYGVLIEGITKFVPRVSRVCRSWYQVSKHPMVWSVLDLPFSILKLTGPKVNHLLSHDLSSCRRLNLTGQSKLQESNIQSILEAMPGLRSLTLSDCYNVKATLFRKISSLTPNLRRFALCYTGDFSATIQLNGIESFLSECGRNLVELRLSRILCVQCSARQVFNAVQEHCPNLEILDLSIPDPKKTTTYPSRKLELQADVFFTQCNKLKELYLDGFNLVWPKSRGPYNYNTGTDSVINLPQLHTLSLGFHRNESTDKPVFYDLFAGEGTTTSVSTSLSYLDVSQSNLLASRIICTPSAYQHQVAHVTELVMRDMKWSDSQHSTLLDCIHAWKHSLVRLDLSHNIMVDGHLDAALLAFGNRRDHYPLESLDLKYTNVTPVAVESVLKNCSSLTEVDLTSCRELPRGCKHFVPKKEFIFLSKSLQRL